MVAFLGLALSGLVRLDVFIDEEKVKVVFK